MALRSSYYKRDKCMTLEDGMTALFAKLTVGSSGAVDATAGFGLAESSPIVRNSAGNYTITLDRAFKKLLNVNAMTVLGTPQGLVMTVTDDSVSSSGALTVEFNSGATATDPSDGAVITFMIVVADTGIENGGV